MSGDFITYLDGIPLTRTTDQKLKKFAKTSSMSWEAAAGYAIERFMSEQGELELRLAAARANADKDKRRER